MNLKQLIFNLWTVEMAILVDCAVINRIASVDDAIPAKNLFCSNGFSVANFKKFIYTHSSAK